MNEKLILKGLKPLYHWNEASAWAKPLLHIYQEKKIAMHKIATPRSIHTSTHSGCFDVRLIYTALKTRVKNTENLYRGRHYRLFSYVCLSMTWGVKMELICIGKSIKQHIPAVIKIFVSTTMHFLNIACKMHKKFSNLIMSCTKQFTG